MTIQIFEISARDPSTGATVTLTGSYGGYVTLHSDTPADTYYPDIIKEPMDVSEGLFSAADLAIGGEVQPDFGQMTLVNDGTLDVWDMYSIAGREIVVYELASLAAAYSSKTQIFRGTVAERPDISLPTIKIKANDQRKLLDAPLQRSRYRGWNGALSLLTATDYVGFGSKPTSLNMVGAMTVEIGVLLDGAEVGHLIGWEYGAGGWRLLRTSIGGTVKLFVSTSADGSTVDGVPANAGENVWAMLSFSRSAGGLLRAYVDGVRVSELQTFATPVASTGDLVIGDAVDGAGAIFGEIRIWSVERTADEIRAAASGEITGDETGLEAYWQCNERSGFTLSDSSGNAVDGTVSLDTLWTDTYEGGADLAGTVKPVRLGYRQNVKAICVSPGNTTGLVYDVHDAATFGALTAISAVYDKGVALILTTDYTVDLANGRFTLLTAPSDHGNVTCDVHGPPSGNEDVPGLLEALAVTYGPIASANTAQMTLLRAYASRAGYDFPGGAKSPTIREAINKVSRGIGIWWRIDSSDELSMGRWGWADALAFDGDEIPEQEIIEIDPIKAPEPVWQVGIGYAENGDVQEGDAVAGSVTQERREFLARPFRYVSRYDDGILSDYPLAEEEVRETSLELVSAAAIEAERQLRLFGVPRRMFRVRVSANWLPQATLAGITVLQHSRWGLAGGQYFLVLGRRRIAARVKSGAMFEYVLWGGLSGFYLVDTAGTYVLDTDGGAITSPTES